MLCLSGFELYSRWVPLCSHCNPNNHHITFGKNKIVLCFQAVQHLLFFRLLRCMARCVHKCLDLLITGVDPGFFLRRGCTRLLLYFNTNKPHSFSFFLAEYQLYQKTAGHLRGLGGCAPPAPFPQIRPCIACTCIQTTSTFFPNKAFNEFRKILSHQNKRKDSFFLPFFFLFSFHSMR